VNYAISATKPVVSKWIAMPLFSHMYYRATWENSIDVAEIRLPKAAFLPLPDGAFSKVLTWRVSYYRHRMLSLA
jgi:hypothetical protein